MGVLPLSTRYYLQGEEATARLGPADDRKVLSRAMVETRQDQQ